MASGLLRRTNRPIRTRFRCGSRYDFHRILNLARPSNSLDHSSTGTPSHVAYPCGYAIVLRQIVDVRFQVLFHSPSGVLFAFPSRYLFTIGRQIIFSLGEWSPQIPAGLHVPGSTQEPIRSRFAFAYGTVTRYGLPFQTVQLANDL